MDQIQETFGNRVRELRQKREMSQEKLALLIDIDRTYLASVERGKRNISLKNIKKIADGLDVSISDLFKNI